MNYIKQLDAIRAFAIIFVLIAHWGSSNLNKILPFGNIGVDVFFVLSGFLITRILLFEKEKIQENKTRKAKLSVISKFMVRRSLRIFPIYYFMLLILYFGCDYWLFNPIPKDWEYYVLYLQNILFYNNQSLPGGNVGHFWTLAVEEQFYLFWPWVLIYINKKYIKHVLVLGIIIGTLSTLFLPLIPEKEKLSSILTICCLHAFCIGGLISYLSLKKDQVLEKNYFSIKILGVIAIFIFLWLKTFYSHIISLDRLLIAIISFWIITSILLNKTEKLNFIFNNKILILIGRFSYGIYVYHNFIPVTLNGLLHISKKKFIESSEIWIGLNFLQNNVFSFNVLCLTVLLGIAYFSFQFIETPFLRLKKYF